ncbi:hypothetical protein [Ewingella americana]|uniref:hypothetical protein n=1 Tax=Ewingella americana TaxID=41202 RepID=UPI001386E1A7|nr:hypothetical protein [Ewingella americana]
MMFEAAGNKGSSLLPAAFLIRTEDPILHEARITRGGKSTAHNKLSVEGFFLHQ